MEEQQLVELSKQGDRDSFNQLVQRYHKLAYNLAYRFLGQAQAAEDATQEAFLSAWQGVGRFRGGNFRAWLLQIVANACRDYLRFQHRHPTTSYESLPIAPAVPSPDPERSLELEDAIQRGLAQLPWEQRLAVILSDAIGLSYDEVAKSMGCSLGTVRSRLSRGRASLRDWLVAHGELFSGQERHNKEKG